MNSRTISTTSISIEIVENMYNEAVVNDDAVCDYSDVDTGALSDLTYEDESDDETSETVEKSSKKTHFKTKTQPPQNKVDLSKQAANPKAREGKPKAKENLRTPRISHKESHRRLHIAKNSLKRVRTQLKGVKELNESLKQKNQVLQMKLDERAIAVKTLRDEQLRVFEKEKFDVEPDSSVTNAFTGIFGGTQSWAKHYAVEGWTEAGKEKFFEALSKFQEEVDGDFISRRLYHTIRLGKLPPRLVLNACVNKTLCREIFERPFAQLSADLSEQKNKEFEDALNWVMASTTEKPTATKHKLRVGLLRGIAPTHTPREAETGSGSAIDPVLQTRHKRRSKVIVMNFVHDFAMLLKPMSSQSQEACIEQLLFATEKAMRISVILATQHPHVEILFLNDLQATSFGINDPGFKAHRGLGILDEEENESEQIAHSYGLIGRPFDMVIEPSVTRYGNRDAENYHRKEILYKGVVWIVKDMDLRSHRHSNTAKLLSTSTGATNNTEATTTSLIKPTQKSNLESPDSRSPEHTTIENRKVSGESNAPDRVQQRQDSRRKIFPTAKKAQIDEEQAARRKNSSKKRSRSVDSPGEEDENEDKAHSASESPTVCKRQRPESTMPSNKDGDEAQEAGSR